MPQEQVVEYWHEHMIAARRKGKVLAKQHEDTGIRRNTYYWVATSYQVGNKNHKLKKELKCINFLEMQSPIEKKVFEDGGKQR